MKMFLARYQPMMRCISASLYLFRISSAAFSTLDDFLECHAEPGQPLVNYLTSNSNSIDEAQVLRQLSGLLPIRSTALINRTVPENLPSLQTSSGTGSSVDGLLPPEDKLRGVFLQKLRGKSRIEQALDRVDVELTLDLISKVLDRGNLSGEAIVTFTNWAIQKPAISDYVAVYNVTLKALGRRKFFTRMGEMLQQLRAQEIEPNHETLSIIMDSFIRAGQVSKALQMYARIADYGLKFDTESLNILLRCLCRRSYVGAANSLLVKLKEKVVFDLTSYNTVIAGWSRFGRISEAQKILKAMVDDGFTPDSLTFSYVIEGLGRASKVNDAMEIFRGLEEEGLLTTEIYNAVIANYIASGDIDECLKYYQKMLVTNCGPDTDTYVRIISGLLKSRRVADALEIFNEMLDRGLVPNTGTMTTFLEPLCTYGPPYAALMIYKKARKIGCRLSLTAYKLLLMRLSKFGKCNLLLNVWDDMQQSGLASDMEVYECIINGLCNIGRLETAVQVMEDSLQKGFCPSKIICSKLNNKLLASNKVEIAYKLLLKIKVARRQEKAKRRWRARGWHF